jgi:uncharacterized protein
LFLQGSESIPVAQVFNVTRNAEVAGNVGMANNSSRRRTGLLKHTALPEGDGLWIVPCESVHTFAMKFPIDVIYLNRKQVVVKIRANMVRSRISFCLRAHSVLELPAGWAAKVGLQVGDQLEVRKQTA